MKTKLMSVLAGSALVFSACGGSSTSENAAAVEGNSNDTLTVDVAASTVNWKGEVAGVYGHNGVIKVQSGTIYVNDSAIVGGEFTVDMKTIEPLDSGYTAENPASKLVAHLGTADFFAVDTFPVATFVISSVQGNEIKGTLTVRGKGNEETIQVESFENNGGSVKATGKLVFDRQKYDVAWVHYMKDMILSDDITLNISLVANK